MLRILQITKCERCNYILNSNKNDINIMAWSLCILHLYFICGKKLTIALYSSMCISLYSIFLLLLIWKSSYCHLFIKAIIKIIKRTIICPWKEIISIVLWVEFFFEVIMVHVSSLFFLNDGRILDYFPSCMCFIC